MCAFEHSAVLKMAGRAPLAVDFQSVGELS